MRNDKTIIIKGDASKIYDEVIFVMKDINFKREADNIMRRYRLRNVYELTLYTLMLIVVVILIIKLMTLS